MVVFSDGFDMTSQYKASEVTELARRTNVPIHIIAAIPDVASAIALKRTSQSTGGTFHILSSLRDLPAVYARIEAALRAQIASHPASKEAADGVEASSDRGGGSATIAVGSIRSRQDAIRALEAAAEFFRRNEPSSPIPLSRTSNSHRADESLTCRSAEMCARSGTSGREYLNAFPSRFWKS
jgi:hypothetical protein